MSTVSQSMVKSVVCRLCDQTVVTDMATHLEDWHRVICQDQRLVASLSFPPAQTPIKKQNEWKSKKKPFDEISNTPNKFGSVLQKVGKENSSSRVIPPMSRTRSKSGQDYRSSEITNWMDYIQTPGSWAQVVHVDSVDSLDSPSKVSINVDKDISFNLDSPKQKMVDGEQFLEGSSTDKDSDIVKENVDEQKIKEAIATRRAMVIANKGRYICPEPSCRFRCEAHEILQIHVRNRHINLWGTPVRKQKMGVRLDKDNIKDDVMKSALREYERSVEKVKTDNVISRAELRGEVLTELNFETMDYCDEFNTLNDSPPTVKYETPKHKGNKRKAQNDCTNKEAKRLKTNAGKKDVRKKVVNRIKQLQKGKSNGTFVQCCRSECAKWRLLPEFEDPAMVPSLWECSMNKDVLLNSCDKGSSEEWVEASANMVETSFAPGSMLWAKIKGFPWWPAMVDFCPDVQEYYWLSAWDEPGKDHVEKGTPSHYHVVLFGVPKVSRSWVRVEDLVKMVTPSTPPTKAKNGKRDKGQVKALDMASKCFDLGREERLRKFSFAVLFTGKWGSYDVKVKKKSSEKKVKSDAKLEPKKEMVEEEKEKEPLKPSQLLSLWGGDVKEEQEQGRTVLGRDGDLLLLSWGQQDMVASYFGGKRLSEGAVKEEERRVEMPALEPNVLVTLAIGTLGNGEGGSVEQISSCVGLLFPFYQTQANKCARLVRGVFRDAGLKTGDVFKPSIVMLKQARQAVEDNPEAVKRGLLEPRLLPLLLAPFPSRPPPSLADPLLATMALSLPLDPITLEQLGILLALLLPGLQPTMQQFLNRFESCVSKEKEFLVEGGAKETRYSLHSASRVRALNNLSSITKTSPTHELKKAFCQPWVMKIVVPA